MEVTYTVRDGILYFALNGEMDEHSAKSARIRADEIIGENPLVSVVAFDLKNVTFMDSTGIGFLIGRYKKLHAMGIDAYVVNPNPSADKILLISGIYSLMPKRNYRSEA